MFFGLFKKTPKLDLIHKELLSEVPCPSLRVEKSVEYIKFSVGNIDVTIAYYKGNKYATCLVVQAPCIELDRHTIAFDQKTIVDQAVLLSWWHETLAKITVFQMKGNKDALVAELENLYQREYHD